MSVWLLKVVATDTRGPAAGVPVTLLDEAGNPAGYWVSDADGVVAIPRRDVASVRLRVGLRSEPPLTLETERLGREIVELEAPRALPATGAGSGTVPPAVAVRGRTAPPAERETPGQVLHFVRIVLLPPEHPLLPAGADAPGGMAAEAGDFLEVSDPLNTDVRYGALIDVEQFWQPLGNVAGELLHSVALGGGDVARVGLADGRWSDGARRPLDAVAALITAAGPQTGGARAPALDEPDLGLEPVTLAAGPHPEAELGHVAAETLRWLNDRTQRVTQAVRRRPLRVVELGDGAGVAPAAPAAPAPPPPGMSAVRTVRAPADGGPVTYHFFEPLARYRVSTRAARLRPAVLVPFRLPNLATRAAVRQFGYILRRSLLDPTLLPVLDQVLGIGAAAEPAAPPVSEIRLVLQRATAEHATPPDLRQVWCFLHVDQTRYTVHFFPADPPPAGVQSTAAPPATHWIGAIRLADFHARPLSYPGQLALQNASGSMLTFGALHIEGRVGESWVRLHSVRDLVLPAQAQVRLATLATLAAAPGVDPSEGRLFAHLAANLPHYAGAVIAAGDPGARYLALSRLADGAGTGRTLAEVVENHVAGVVGNYLAFPLRAPSLAPVTLRKALEHYADRPARTADDVVVTLPVPGVWISRQSADAPAADATEAAGADGAAGGGSESPEPIAPRRTIAAGPLTALRRAGGTAPGAAGGAGARA
jgi:hypothetical protein